MKEKRYRYTVTLPDYVTLEKIFDMFRYSGDVVVDKISDKPFSFVMEHTMVFESKEHLERQEKHFKGQILGRWGSFGCKVSDVRKR